MNNQRVKIVPRTTNTLTHTQSRTHTSLLKIFFSLCRWNQRSSRVFLFHLLLPIDGKPLWESLMLFTRVMTNKWNTVKWTMLIGQLIKTNIKSNWANREFHIYFFFLSRHRVPPVLDVTCANRVGGVVAVVIDDTFDIICFRFTMLVFVQHVELGTIGKWHTVVIKNG